MPIEILPQNARSILKETEILSKYFGVEVGIVSNADVYISIHKLLAVAEKLKLFNAVEELDRIKMETKLKDISQAKFITLSQSELNKLMRERVTERQRAHDHLSKMIEEGDLKIVEGQDEG